MSPERFGPRQRKAVDVRSPMQADHERRTQHASASPVSAAAAPATARRTSTGSRRRARAARAAGSCRRDGAGVRRRRTAGGRRRRRRACTATSRSGRSSSPTRSATSVVSAPGVSASRQITQQLLHAALERVALGEEQALDERAEPPPSGTTSDASASALSTWATVGPCRSRRRRTRERRHEREQHAEQSRRARGCTRRSR